MDVFYKTHLVDPVSHSDSRTVFKFPKILLNCETAEIGNVAVTLSDDTALYNLIGGALNTIKNITLKLNGLEVDNNRAPQYINTVLQPLTSDGHNNNVNSARYGNKNSYTFTRNLIDSSISTAITRNSDKILYLAPNELTVDKKNSNSLPLNKLLGFFRSKIRIEGQDFPIIPLNMMNGDCELVIEWQDIPAIFCDKPAATITEVQRPFLILDEINNNELSMMLASNNLSWNYPSWEWSQYLVASGESLNSRVNALNGKFVKKLAVISNFPSVLNDNMFVTCSQFIVNEVIRISVNHKDLMDFNGCDTAAKKTMFFNSSWGEYILPLGGNYDCNIDDIYFPSNSSNCVAGELSLFGCTINERVKDIQLQLTGTISATLNVNIIGEVQRGIQLNPNGDFIAFN